MNTLLKYNAFGILLLSAIALGMAQLISGAAQADDASCMKTWHLDSDGDGYGDPAKYHQNLCSPPSYAKFVNNSGDCDDSNPNVHAVTACYPDYDGDGYGDPNKPGYMSCYPLKGYATKIDCDDSNKSITAKTYYKDTDGDGLGDPNNPVLGCSPSKDHVTNKDDCNDSDKSSTTNTYYLDKDGDGFGNPNYPVSACSSPPGSVANKNDCNDSDAKLNIGTTVYRDKDGDGFGDPNSKVVACPLTPKGYVSNKDDCNDSDKSISATKYYKDEDGDGFGDPNLSVLACAPPPSYVAKIDCDDSDPAKTCAITTKLSGIGAVSLNQNVVQDNAFVNTFLRNDLLASDAFMDRTSNFFSYLPVSVAPLNFSVFKTQGTKQVFPYKADKTAYSAWCNDKMTAKCPKVVDIPWSQVGGGQFDGSTQWVVVPKITNQLPLSVGGWFCPDSANNLQAFVGKNGNGGENQFLLGFWDNSLLLAYGAQTWKIMPAQAGCHHVVVSAETSAAADAATLGKVRLKIYINGGAQIQTYYAKDPLPVDGRDWSIGQKWDGNSLKDFFKGEMYNVFVVPNLLTGATVKSLYELSLAFDLNAAKVENKPGVAAGQCGCAVGDMFCKCPVSTAMGGTRFSGKNYAQLPPGTVGPVFEWSFWVNPETTANQAFLGKHDAAGNNQLLVGFWEGSLKVGLGDKDIKIGPAFTGWHKLDLQFLRHSLTVTKLTVYQDGVQVYAGDVTHSAIDLDAGRPWVVAQEWDGGNVSDFFTGTIYDLTLQRVAKSESLKKAKVIAFKYDEDKKAMPELASSGASIGGAARQTDDGLPGGGSGSLAGDASTVALADYWTQEGTALVDQAKSIIQSSKDILDVQLAIQVGRYVALENVLGTSLDDCAKKIPDMQGDELSSWVAKNCAVADNAAKATSKLSDDIKLLQKLLSERAKNFESVRQKFSDLLESKQKMAKGDVDSASLQVLSKATSTFFVALLAMVSEYDLTMVSEDGSVACDDPVLNDLMIDGLMGLDSEQKVNANALHDWAKIVGCQNTINLSYADNIIYQTYLGVISIVEKYLGKSEGLNKGDTDAIRARLLRNLSPYLLVLFDADKRDASVPSRDLLREYSSMVGGVIAGKVVPGPLGLTFDSVVGTGIYPTLLFVRDPATKEYLPQNVCPSDVSLPLDASLLPEDKSTLGNVVPFADAWLVNQWKTESCDNPKKWNVTASVADSTCISLPNLIDVATNRITMGDGSCAIWDSAMKNISCCPSFFSIPATP